jgi:hypothetical protein
MDFQRLKTVAAVVAALLFPGLGHLLIGKWVRAILFTVAILLLFYTGILLEGKLYGLDFEQPLYNLPFLADASIGIPYFLSVDWGYGAGNMQNQSFDYGTTFLIVAGLLNLLVAFNVYDIAVGRKK